MYKFFKIIYPGALINNAYVDDKTVMYTYAVQILCCGKAKSIRGDAQI